MKKMIFGLMVLGLLSIGCKADSDQAYEDVNQIDKGTPPPGNGVDKGTPPPPNG